MFDEWAFAFDWLEPVEPPKPEPGEGYRLLSKDPPEDVIEGDEFKNPYTKKWELDHGDFPTSQADDIYYRRKIAPAEAPKLPTEPTLNSDTISEGYRKLGDSSVEPRQIGDLRWSVAEKRYVEIKSDEIVLVANRDNWAACRKITPEATREVTWEVNPPDGWRWLDKGEIIRKGDQPIDGMELRSLWIGTPCASSEFIMRRNRFEVGKKVVRVSNGVVYEVVRILSMGYQLKSEFNAEMILNGKSLAPYIEDAK